jgi:type I restriction enzyme S subunit
MEQDRICSWLAEQCLSIDQSRATAAGAVLLAREYRSRLIADVVTGKLDVREAVARLPEEIEDAEDVDGADAIQDADAEVDEELEPEEVGA